MEPFTSRLPNFKMKKKIESPSLDWILISAMVVLHVAEREKSAFGRATREAVPTQPLVGRIVASRSIRQTQQKHQ
jgi:hypothetical protein